MINKKKFGLFIKERRLEKKMTQKDLAKELLVSESAISKWEIGQNYPDITMVSDISRILDISEQELIKGAHDTEYRQLKNQVKSYRLISNTWFIGINAIYLISFLISLLSDVIINKKVTFSPIVFCSLVVASSFIPSFTRFSKQNKMFVFIITTYLSVTLLLLICCITYKQSWFGIASCSILLAYLLIGLPFLIKKYLPASFSHYSILLYIIVVFISLFILLLVTRITIRYDFQAAVNITVFLMIPFLVVSFSYILNLDRYLKLSISICIFTLTFYSSQYIVNLLLGYNKLYLYQINFNDWEKFKNGNIYILILIIGLSFSCYFLWMYFKKNKHTTSTFN